MNKSGLGLKKISGLQLKFSKDFLSLVKVQNMYIFKFSFSDSRADFITHSILFGPARLCDLQLLSAERKTAGHMWELP